jgi:hypothetical protein
MVLRRALYWAQFGMAVALPIWVLVTRGIIADGVGWQFVIYLVLAPVLFVTLAVLLALSVILARVRGTRVLSWPDVAVLLVMWASIITYGLFAFPALAVVVVLSIVAGFWVVVWELATAARARVKTFFEGGTAPSEPKRIPDVIVVPRDPLSR